jgi:hypothetical protein
MNGVTYVMTHRGYRSVKVGYTSLGSARYEDLMRHGWQPYRHLQSASTELARRVEQLALFDIRFRLHVPIHLTSAHMGHLGGWTETSSEDLLNAKEAWDLVCEQGGREQLAPVVERLRGQRGLVGGPAIRGVRSSGDTPRYVKAARIEASRTARALRVSGPQQPKPNSTKNAAQKDAS